MNNDKNDSLVLSPPDAPPAENLLAVIAHAVADPRCDVAKMEKLLDMHQRIVTEQRKTAFMAAMARVAVKLPEIGKLGQSHHGKYARLEDIDRAIRPIISEEGLSLSFDSQPIDGKVRVTCKLSHADGHSETKQIDLPLDTSGSKNGAQSVISTVSYGRRALTKMFFNLVEAGEDTDANDPTCITEEQARDIRTMLQDLKSDERNFLDLIAGVSTIEQIPARDHKRIINALETKGRLKREAEEQKARKQK